MATGRGVHVYVVDSGIEIGHKEFEGRADHFWAAPKLRELDVEDCTGHGTHVAGVIAGKNTGVAKKALLHDVRVIGCKDESSNSDIIMALDHILQQHDRATPGVVNLSLGPDSKNAGPKRSAALDAAIQSVIAAGITVVAAAGNDAINGCDMTPAGTEGVITVGASNEFDYRASFSNFGPCVSVFAPGTEVISAKVGGGHSNKRGTSQASPFVAGVVAQYLQGNPSALPAEVLKALQDAASRDVLKSTN